MVLQKRPGPEAGTACNDPPSLSALSILKSPFEERVHESRSHLVGVKASVPTLVPGCVSLGQSHHHSEPRAAQLQNSPTPCSLWRLQMEMGVQWAGQHSC